MCLDEEVRQKQQRREAKKTFILWERLNLRQFLLSYTGVRRTLNPPLFLYSTSYHFREKIKPMIQQNKV